MNEVDRIKSRINEEELSRGDIDSLVHFLNEKRKKVPLPIFWNEDMFNSIEFDTIQIGGFEFCGHPEYRGLQGSMKLFKDGKEVWCSSDCDSLFDVWNYEFLEMFRDDFFEPVQDIPVEVMERQFSKVPARLTFKDDEIHETGSGKVIYMGYNGTDH